MEMHGILIGYLIVAMVSVVGFVCYCVTRWR